MFEANAERPTRNVSARFVAKIRTPDSSSIPETGSTFHANETRSFIGERFRRNTQQASCLKTEQTEKHQTLAEDILNTGEVGQDARPDCEHHGCRKSDRKRVTRCTPDAAVYIGKCSPDTHRSSHDQPCIRQTNEGRKTWMDALSFGSAHEAVLRNAVQTRS